MSYKKEFSAKELSDFYQLIVPYHIAKFEKNP